MSFLSFWLGLIALTIFVLALFRPQTFESFRSIEEQHQPLATRLALLTNVLLVVIVLLLAAVWLK